MGNTGYTPKGKLDESNPSKGGSGVVYPPITTMKIEIGYGNEIVKELDGINNLVPKPQLTENEEAIDIAIEILLNFADCLPADIQEELPKLIDALKNDKKKHGLEGIRKVLKSDNTFTWRSEKLIDVLKPDVQEKSEQMEE